MFFAIITYYPPLHDMSIAMIFYFLLSIVQSLAAHKLKKEADVNATKKRNEARVQLRTRLTKRH